MASSTAPLTCSTRPGFALTRSSVTQLNGLVLNALLRCEVPAASLPASPRWCKRRNVMGSGAALCADVAQAWRAGLLPVLHGDAVFDERQVRMRPGARVHCGYIRACVHRCLCA
jgi:isopentenyl phosphate kinase